MKLIMYMGLGGPSVFSKFKEREISPVELIYNPIVFLLKKRNKGRRKSGLFNDIGIFTSDHEITKFLEEIGSSRDEYKVIPFTLNKSKYHTN